MTAELVLIHGRSQQNKDGATLKAEWLDALGRGLATAGLTLPISPDAVRFPYYGDTLDQMSRGITDGTAAAVIIKGTEDDAEEQDFLTSVLDEARLAHGVTEDQIRQADAGHAPASPDRLPAAVPLEVERGLRPTAWMHAVLRALDHYVPQASGPTLALATHDVYQYLRNPGIRDAIDTGVRQALTPGVKTVVVAHSLGTVVAYNILRRETAGQGWTVPQLVTLGSPLAVSAIKQALAPITRPPIGAWFNAADPHDIVALWPLSQPHFTLDPAVRNKTDVNNHTDNRHGIAGYLDDPDVASTIHNALIT